MEEYKGRVSGASDNFPLTFAYSLHQHTVIVVWTTQTLIPGNEQFYREIKSHCSNAAAGRIMDGATGTL